MSLRQRIFSLETEYGLQFYPTDGRNASDVPVVSSLVAVVAEKFGTNLRDDFFLVNGSKLHVDIGHPEWSLPECSSAREAATYDKAADHLLRAAIPEAERRLEVYGHKGQLKVFKNNFDSEGHTFGCHENYLMQRDARLLRDEEGQAFLRYLVRCLVPFLVTRTLLCGAGMLQVGLDGRVSFELSQRAPFIEAVVGPDTTVNRPIVNVGREGQSLSQTEHRRVHLIVGDSNVSGWSTWMKLGTTGLLLRLIEDLYFNDIPLLADPVAALQAVSKDVDRSETILLRDGTSIEPVDIQWQYYEAVHDYVEEFGMSDEEANVLEAWGEALEELSDSDNPAPLHRRADWAIKKKMIDGKLKSLGHTWNDLHVNAKSIAALRAIDMRYHDMSKEGYFSRTYPVDTLVKMDEIEPAQNEPPAYTRANVRGKAISNARNDEFKVEVKRWTDLTVDSSPVNLRDPLQFVHPAIPDTCYEFELRKALENSDPEVIVRTMDYMGRLGGETNLELLSIVIDKTDNEVFRRAAIKAVAEIEDADSLSVLIKSLDNADVQTQWVLKEALKRVDEPKAEDKWGDSSTKYTDDDEPLVNFT